MILLQYIQVDTMYEYQRQVGASTSTWVMLREAFTQKDRDLRVMMFARKIHYNVYGCETIVRSTSLFNNDDNETSIRPTSSVAQIRDRA
jgi:hypothetical protein